LTASIRTLGRYGFLEYGIYIDFTLSSASKLLNHYDMIDGKGINARAVIPARDIATVLCLENGDVFVLSAYNGFDKIYLLTLMSNVDKKLLWLEQLAKCFKHIEEGKLDKIEVKGF